MFVDTTVDRSHASARPPAAARSRRVLGLLAERERIEAELIAEMAGWIGERAWAADGSLSPMAWLTHRGALPRRAASALVASASLVRRHEPVRDALESSSIRTAHVATLARAARHRDDVFAEHVDGLVDAAESVEPEPFRTVVQRWCVYADDRIDRRPVGEDRWLDVAVTFGGSVRIDGLLDPEGGAAFLTALEAHQPPPPAGDSRSAATRRADALLALAGAARPTVSLDVIVDIRTLAGLEPTDLAGLRHDLVCIGPIRPSVIERLACDANVGRIIMDGPSEVLNLGRRTRRVSVAQRRALIARDGGPTDIDHLALECRPHHNQSHEPGAIMERGPDGKWEIIPP